MSNNPRPSGASANDQLDHTHIVVRGETLGKVASRYNIKLSELLAANPDIKDANKIMVGQRLKLPVVTTAGVAEATGTATEATVEAETATEPTTGEGLPKTDDLDEEGKYHTYAPYFAKVGVRLDVLGPDERAILGLRVRTRTNVNSNQGMYDDRMVVAWAGADGRKHVREFFATTEPCAKYEGRQGQDANRDGRLDLGCLPDGLYHYHKETGHPKYGKILRPDSEIFVTRDVNHDGFFDEKDMNPSNIKSALSSGLSILFHKGGNTMTGSAGCQTFKPGEFEKFWQALGDQKKFEYALITVK